MKNSDSTGPDKSGGRSASRRKLPFWIPLAAFLLTLPLFLSPLDHKFYDFFLFTLPTLKESEQVRVLTVDDASIEVAGGFPFRREVMADVVILLRELGVKSISFDLSYLDESPYRLDPEYAKNVFSLYLDEGFGEINSTVEYVINGFTTGEISRVESALYKDEFISLNNRVRGTLEDALGFLARDVDAYFAKALRLSACSYLTLTMMSRADFPADVEIPALEGEAAELLDVLALRDIEAVRDSKTPEMVSVMPAITKLLRLAKGAGTVNAGPDVDGIRRRVHLLMKFQDNYYPNLALAGMHEILGKPAIAVNSNEIVLRDAVVNGVSRDIRIPRARDGSVLLKWPKKPFNEYKKTSIVELIQHTGIEPVLAENFYNMDISGFFYFFDGEENPYQLYLAAEGIKERLLERYSDSLAERWLVARGRFFAAAEDFLSGPYEETILAMVEGDAETESYVERLFAACKDQLSRLNEIRRNAAYLKGAFCVIGSDATSMTDVGTTPVEEDFPNVGTYAVVANMFLSGEFLDEAPLFISAIIGLIFSFAIVLVASRWGSGRSILAGILGLVLLAAMLLGYFHLTKRYIASAVPLISTALSFIAVTAANFLGANREKAFLHSAFSRYLSPQVINEIIADPSKLNLGGEKREMSAIFTDIQKFSTLSEKLDPAHLVKLLNKYLTAMSNIIMENGGTVDKYEGDAIIAFFGAPLPRADHAALACRSALAMKRSEAELNKVFMEEGVSPTPLFTRIGVNTGEMVVGNMGAENKMDYTIMGNAVNLAARLEGVNKHYNTGGILISEYTRTPAGAEFVCRRLDRVRVVGINTPLRLYELLGLESEMDDTQRARLDSWDEAITMYENRDFTNAAALFVDLNKRFPDDLVAEFYARRSYSYMKSPPPDDWDGVNNLTEK